MPRSEIEKRVGAKEEVSHELVASKKVFAERENRVQNQDDAEDDTRKRTSAAAHRRDFEAAKQRLGNMTYAQTVQFLTDMPSGVMELYLLAEEATQNRPLVLGRFPKPGTLARERYLSVAVGA